MYFSDSQIDTDVKLVVPGGYISGKLKSFDNDKVVLSEGYYHFHSVDAGSIKKDYLGNTVVHVMKIVASGDGVNEAD